MQNLFMPEGGSSYSGGGGEITTERRREKDSGESLPDKLRRIPSLI